jgi:hypothetical protein
MPDPNYKALCAELVVIEDAMSGGSVQLSSQGQALDGYAALAAFRYIAAKARIALALAEPVAPTDEELLLMACMTGLVYDNGCGAFPSSFIEGTDTTRETLAFARAVLAHWGTPANNTREEN